MKPKIRSSSLDTVIGCHGSRTLDELKAEADALWGAEAPEPGDQEMAWRGNWIHWRAFSILIEKYGAVGSLPARPEVPDGWKPDRWCFRVVEWFVSSFLRVVPDDHAIYVENYFEVEFERFILTGHLDVFTINPDKTQVSVNDLKTGPVEVDDPEENWQLASYLTLLKDKFPNIQNADLRIFQMQAEDSVREFRIDGFADAVAAEVVREINVALDDPYTLQTGYKQCRFCQHMFYCPALEKEIHDMKLKLSEIDMKKLALYRDIGQLAELYDQAKAVATPIQKMGDEVKRRIKASNGGAITLPDGREARIIVQNGGKKVTHPAVAFEFIREKVGDDNVWDVVDVSVTKTEDALVEHLDMQRESKDPEKDTAKRWIHETLGHIIQQGTREILKIK